MSNYRKALKNYTTEASTSKMIADIQNIILDFGGVGIIFDYDLNRRINSLIFKIIVDGSTRMVNVPFFVEKTKGVLIQQGVIKEEDNWTPETTIKKNDDKAYRVTLANVRDWLDAQLAIYATQMFEFPQLFLPYMQNKDGQSYYEVIKNSNFTLSDSSTKTDE